MTAFFICLIVSYPKWFKAKGNALLPLFLNFALEYTIRKVQKNQVGLKLNGTHQFLSYADDVNLLGDIIESIKVGLEGST
jgi:hypothetical protein